MCLSDVTVHWREESFSAEGAEDGADKDDNSLPSIIGGEVTVIWVNAL